jgi:hypothetical protein
VGVLAPWPMLVRGGLPCATGAPLSFVSRCVNSPKVLELGKSDLKYPTGKLGSVFPRGRHVDVGNCKVLTATAGALGGRHIADLGSPHGGQESQSF